MIDSIVQYFEHIPSLHRALILAGGISFFWIIEGVVPQFNFTYHKWKHASLNLFFTLTTIIINFAFALLIVRASDWTVSNHFGLMQLVEMPVWLFMVVGLLLMDLIGAYLIHWIEHKK